MANVMKKIAKALGLELGEEFRIDCDDEKTRYVLMEDGLFKKVCDKTYIQYDIDNLITGEWEAIKLPKPILDEVEKKYLSAMIKPFSKYVKYICKRDYEKNERITIYYHEYVDKIISGFSLPSFEKGKMYKGMKTNKRYTVKELGL